MADEENSFGSVELEQLLSAPISALIGADSHGAKATVDFIRQVGFVSNKDEDPYQFGSLRTISFQYKSTDAKGNTVEKVLTVPLLSIVPIPMLSIEEAEIDLKILIDGVVRPEDLKGDEQSLFMEQQSGVKLLANIGHGNVDSTTDETPGSMRVKIKLKSGDLPNGLNKILNAVDNAISHDPNKGK